MKKKYVTIVTILLSGVIYSQGTGKVGINTVDPTNVLDVNGTVRVRDLLPNIYNPAVDKIVIADNNGVLKSVPAGTIIIPTPTYETLFDLNVLGTANITDADPDADNPRTPVVIQNQTIVLSKEAMVQINFSVPIDQVYHYNTTDASIDGRIKMLRTELVVDNTILLRATNTYTNGSIGSGIGTNVAALDGLFYNTGSFFIKLAAGTHTIRLAGTCNPYLTCKQGGNHPGTRFQALAIYNQ